MTGPRCLGGDAIVFKSPAVLFQLFPNTDDESRVKLEEMASPDPRPAELLLGESRYSVGNWLSQDDGLENQLGES